MNDSGESSCAVAHPEGFIGLIGLEVDPYKM